MRYESPIFCYNEQYPQHSPKALVSRQASNISIPHKWYCHSRHAGVHSTSLYSINVKVARLPDVMVKVASAPIHSVHCGASYRAEPQTFGRSNFLAPGYKAHADTISQRHYEPSYLKATSSSLNNSIVRKGTVSRDTPMAAWSTFTRIP